MRPLLQLQVGPGGYYPDQRYWGAYGPSGAAPPRVSEAAGVQEDIAALSLAASREQTGATNSNALSQHACAFAAAASARRLMASKPVRNWAESRALSRRTPTQAALSIVLLLHSS